MSDVEVEVDPHEIQQQGRPLSPLQQEINVEQRLISHLDRLDQQLEAFRQQQQRPNKVQERKHKFKYRSNEMQYNFNLDLLESLETVKDNVEQGFNMNFINDMKAMIERIKNRNKVLKLADRSPGGWDTVAEYLSDDLADNSADERKIRTAETRAISKKTREQRWYPYQRSSSTLPYSTFRRGATGFQVASRTMDLPSQPTQPTQRNHIFRWAPYQYNPPGFRRGYNVGRSTEGATCFACGGRGHYRRFCPSIRPQSQQSQEPAPS